MKKLFLLFGVVLFSQALSAQFISNGKQLGTLGVGGSRGASLLGGMWEIGVGEKVGIGQFGVGALGGLYIAGGSNALGVGAQANYHFNLNAPKWDLYAGLNFIAVFAGGSGSDLGFQLGGRYAVQNDFSLFVQLGADGFATIFAGLSFRL